MYKIYRRDSIDRPLTDSFFLLKEYGKVCRYTTIFGAPRMKEFILDADSHFELTSYYYKIDAHRYMTLSQCEFLVESDNLEELKNKFAIWMVRQRLNYVL